MRLYIMKDTIAETVGQPMGFPNDQSLARALAKSKFPPGTKKNDFAVFLIGEMCEFDVPDRQLLAGTLTPVPIPKLICTLPAEDVPLESGPADMMKLLENNNGK